MKIRFISISLSFLLAFGVMIAPVKAAMAVYDHQAVTQMIKNVQQVAEQIELARRNLEKLNQAVAENNIDGVKRQINALSKNQQNVKGIVEDYKELQKIWDETYKDSDALDGMSGKEYADHAQKVLDVTNNSVYDAMVAQGMTAEIGNDAQNLETLLEASQDADGALTAAQVANQIAGIQIVQLMRLQEIVSKSNRAQSTYLAQQQQQEAAVKSAAKKLFGVKDNNEDSE